MVSDSRTAMFAEMLALLAEHAVPLPEAVRLAAETTGDRRTVQSAQKIAEAIRAGQPLSEGLPACPPVLAWLLSTGSEQPLLCSAARNTAEHYAWRAKYRFEIVQLVLPIIATAAVGGVVTISYALTLYVPWTNLLQSLH
jgi:type II secretory pathway component PulF